MPYISIVSPVYCAENCVSELCRRISQVVISITEDFEIILVDDCSLDGSWDAIITETNKDHRVRGIQLSQNFGQHKAISAGLDFADGEWVVVLDCDLQDPPEAIQALHAKALEGYQVVIAQFEERIEKGWPRLRSILFWNILSWLSGIKFDNKVGNFRIMSRNVVSQFRLYREQLRLMGGIINLMGFSSSTSFISVRREQRYSGQTTYTFRKLLVLALEIALAYSDKPLKMSVMIGFLLSLTSILSGCVIIYLSHIGYIQVPGWVSVIVSVYFLAGLIIANLGILGFYIAKIFTETKRRPLYVIDKTTMDTHVTSALNIPKKLNKNSGQVIWITGLSGAGKSTLANIVANKLRACGSHVIVLDGDELREVISSTHESYNRDDRLLLALKYSQLCQMLSKQGITVVIATISLFKEVFTWNRNNIQNYFEVYLKVPISELKRRDPKGIYRKFDEGLLANVAGLDLAIDEPLAPDLVIEFDTYKGVSQTADTLLKHLNMRNKS